MIPARGWLHLGALLISLILPIGWVMILFHDDIASGLRKSMIFGVPGLLAAQLAAWLRWGALKRRAVSGDGWKTGLGMAAITHVWFGIFAALGLAASNGWKHWLADGSIGNLLGQAIFFTLGSIGAVGAITFPTTALLAHRVASLRHCELVR